MDNAQKAIMLGVGLFITIIVIAAVMAITGIGQDLIGQGTSQLTGISSQLLAQIRADYDNKILSGTQVKTVVNKYYTDETVALYIVSANTALTVGENADNKALLVDANRASSLELSGGNKLVLLADTNSVNGYAAHRYINSAAYSGNVALNVKQPSKSAPAITSQIKSSYQYKSVLISDENTGSIVGILMIRYQ